MGPGPGGPGPVCWGDGRVITENVNVGRGRPGAGLAAEVAAVSEAMGLLRLRVYGLEDRARAAAVCAMADGDHGEAAAWRVVLVDLEHAARAMNLAHGWAEDAAGRVVAGDG